jgi:O-antigen/teichoic acid export membrane protein
MLTNAGVPDATAKFIADGRHHAREVERSAQMLLLGLSVLLLAVCWLLAPEVAGFLRIRGGQVLFRIAILDLPLAALYVSYDGILNGHRQFGAVAMAHVVYGLTKLGAVIALIGLGFSIERVLMASVLSTGMACAVLMVRYPPRGFEPRAESLARAGDSVGGVAQ